MYLYYAIFEPEGTFYNVSFPDLDGAFTSGDSMDDALYMAKDLLEGWLQLAAEDGETFPQPSDPKDIPIEGNQVLLPIEVDLDTSMK